MPRFVILRHELPESSHRRSHWDLMLETNGVLRTWELSDLPRFGRPTVAAPLADHRLDYLDYEGPVSNNRGAVARVDAGDYRWLEDSPAALRVVLDGEKLRGTLKIVPTADPAGYSAIFVPAD